MHQRLPQAAAQAAAFLGLEAGGEGSKGKAELVDHARKLEAGTDQRDVDAWPGAQRAPGARAARHEPRIGRPVPPWRPHRSAFPVIIGRTAVRQRLRAGRDAPCPAPPFRPFPAFIAVLYLAIPAHNEVATIGVLLWRLRTVLAEFPREYEVVVYDDASTDETADVAAQYERAMPVTVLRGRTRLGYAGAVDALLRHVATRTRYPRRDAVLLMQGDFTDPPGIVPEFARRFEGGADLVVGERLTVADAPSAVKRLFMFGHWAMRPFVKVQGVADLTASMRLVRISALREAIRVAGNSPLASGNSWTANADLLLRLAPHARRVESVPMEPTFGVRMRETRRVAMADTISTLKWAWAARGRRAVVGSSPAETGPDDRRGARQSGRRRDEPELSVERLREKVRERDGSTGIDGEPHDPRRRRKERPERAERQPREKTRPPRPEREARVDGTPEARPPRRREEPRTPFNDPTLELDDPFAAPAPPVPPAPFPPMDQEDEDPADDRAGDVGATDDVAAAIGDDGDEGEPRRKRRRNRRSRRGRRKTSEAGAEGEALDADDEPGDADAAGDADGDAGEPPRQRIRFTPADHVDGEPVAPERTADEAHGDDGEEDDLTGGVESMADGAARQRRRGRRGRRGGARRSRGRREQGPEDGAPPEVSGPSENAE